MKDIIGVGDINAVIIEINKYFLTGKTKIGAKLTADNGITIYKIEENSCESTIEDNLPITAAYAYLEGVKLGMIATQWD